MMNLEREIVTEEENLKEEVKTQKKLWNNAFFLGFVIFLFAPVGLGWMWVDKGFGYKKSTKIIVTIAIVLAGVATIFGRAAIMEKYPELKGQPNTVIVQTLLEK